MNPLCKIQCLWSYLYLSQLGQKEICSIDPRWQRNLGAVFQSGKELQHLSLKNSDILSPVQVGQFCFYKNGPTPDSFVFIFVKTQILQKTVGLSENRNRNVRLEGKQADHLTTNTASVLLSIVCGQRESRPRNY